MHDYDLIAVMEGRHPTAPLPDLQMIVQDDLTAVLSASPRPTTHPPQSLRQHLANVAVHLARQTACMMLSPLLPARPDTPLTRDGAAAFLTANQPFLNQLLTRYAGMAQVQVTVSWQESGVLSRFGQEPELAPLLDQATASAETFARAVHRMAVRIAAVIGADLATVATDIAPLTLAPDLLWSGVVLLPLRRLGDLNRVLDKVAAIWPDGLRIRQIGPDPITSFATLDLSPVTPRQIDQALSSFGLRSVSDLGQLAVARRRKLMAVGRFDDMAQRAEICDQAAILVAAARLNGSRDGFSLCRIWTDGRDAARAQSRDVA